MTPEEHLERVESREAFLAFLKSLQLDCESEHAGTASARSPAYGPGPRGWENRTIEAFLDAMHAWAVDSGALPVEPTWRAMAQLFLAGKAYE